MDEQADSARPPCETAYRKRRRSYSAAINKENSLDEQPMSMESYPNRDVATQTRYCHQHEYTKQGTSSSELQTCSAESLAISKRELTRMYSADSAKSWSEIEIPVSLLAHPEMISCMARCRCNTVTQCNPIVCPRCSLTQCQCQIRKISSTSSCCVRDSILHVGAAKRKDSGHSESTCQSFLPSSCGSLYHCFVDNYMDNRTIQRRHSIGAGPIQHHRHSDQTHSLRDNKINRLDYRRLSEQRFAEDTIGNNDVTSTASAAEPSIIARTCPPASLLPAVRTTESIGSPSPSSSSRRKISNVSVDIKSRKNNELPPKSAGKKSAEVTATNRKTSVAPPITPRMVKRRFSEQLILEGGLGSASEVENLLDEQPENEDEGSLTGINARKKIKLKRHYYPEGGWGWIIVVITSLVHLIVHGLQLTSGLLMSPAMTRFEQVVENAGIIT